MHRIIYFLVLVLHSNMLNGQITSEALQAASEKHSSEFFIENEGQWPSNVLYLARLGGLDTWITKEGMTFDTYRLEELFVDETTPNTEIRLNKKEDQLIRFGQIIKLNLVNSNPEPLANGQFPSDSYHNYFIGNDASKWKSFVRLYDEVLVENIYTGIDVRYYFERNFENSESKTIRYDFVVRPGANPSDIKLAFDGADHYYLNETSELVLQTRFGEMKHMDLFSYQMVDGLKKEISSSFIKNSNGSIGFSLGTFDPSLPLVIDPLVYSTFNGGSSSITAVRVDDMGNAIVAGIADGAGFPVVAGAYDLTANGSSDIFVSKLDASGSDLIFSTFIGGNGSEFARAMTTDEDGNSYLTGVTSAWNPTNTFPTTAGVFNETVVGYEYNVFITKLNASGSALIYSTIIARAISNNQEANDIVVDQDLNAYITGTYSGNTFPVTPGAFNSDNSPSSAAFVAKLNSDGSDLIYASAIADGSYGNGIDIDSDGNAIVVGGTAYSASNFPTTSGSFDQSYNGAGDAFVTKINNSGTAILYSTFLGSSSAEFAKDVKLDSFGNAIVFGDTYSANFPIMGDVLDSSYNATTDMFLTKLNSSGSALIYSTFLGSMDIENSEDLDIDNEGNVYLTGATFSSSFPTTVDGFDQSFNGGDTDVFLTVLDSIGNSILYSTYLGGLGNEFSKAIDMRPDGSVYVVGSTTLTGYPTTPGVYDTVSGNVIHGFVTKFCFGFQLGDLEVYTNSPVCVGEDIELGIDGDIENSYYWSGPNGFVSNDQFPIISSSTLAMSGTYYVSVSSCSEKMDSVEVLVQPIPIVQAEANVIFIPLGGTVNFNSAGSNATDYLWNFGDGQSSTQANVSHTFLTVGNNYIVLTGTTNGCSDSTFLTIHVNSVGIDQNFDEHVIAIYPNPSQGNFVLQMDIQNSGNIEIALHNMIGQTVFAETLDNYSGSALSYDISSEASGLYLLTVKTDQGIFNKQLEIIK